MTSGRRLTDWLGVTEPLSPRRYWLEIVVTTLVAVSAVLIRYAGWQLVAAISVALLLGNIWLRMRHRSRS